MTTKQNNKPDYRGELIADLKDMTDREIICAVAAHSHLHRVISEAIRSVKHNGARNVDRDAVEEACRNWQNIADMLVANMMRASERVEVGISLTSFQTAAPWQAEPIATVRQDEAEAARERAAQDTVSKPAKPAKAKGAAARE